MYSEGSKGGKRRTDKIQDKLSDITKDLFVEANLSPFILFRASLDVSLLELLIAVADGHCMALHRNAQEMMSWCCKKRYRREENQGIEENEAK